MQNNYGVWVYCSCRGRGRWFASLNAAEEWLREGHKYDDVVCRSKGD